jgi:hypothetical protein
LLSVLGSRLKSCLVASAFQVDALNVVHAGSFKPSLVVCFYLVRAGDTDYAQGIGEPF